MARGGARGVKKSIRIASGNELARSVERSLDEYFRKLDGEPPHCIYEMVIAHVERALLTSVLDRSYGNQTHAAEMLGLNRNTLRAKLAKYKLI
jgi:Fis family transcriptional regulator